MTGLRAVVGAGHPSRDVSPAQDGSTDPMVPSVYRVANRRVEIQRDPTVGMDEVVTLVVEPVDHSLETPTPGQFFMLWVPGVGEVPVSVSSLSGAGKIGFTIRAVGATTSALGALHPSDAVGLRGPFGRGWSALDPTQRVVVVSGGIGLAPLRLHIETLLVERSGRPDPGIVLVIGARTPGEILYPGDIDAWSEHCQVHVTVDRARPGWHGEVGLVTSTLARLSLDPGVAAALCGPEIMMRMAAADLEAAGAASGRVEVSLERSMACAVAHCGRCQVGPVMLCRDGPVLTWPEASALMGVRRW
jgi:anaerobic sulfite reductase subunit B